MTELLDVLGKPSEDAPSPFRVARVISVSGRSLTVDFGSGVAGTVVQATASCNPKPGDNVFIAMDKNLPVALGVLSAPYRQAVLTATADATNSVTGLLNGVSTAVTKVGAFTASPGDQLPLLWANDGSGVWVLAKAGASYLPPAGGAGGGSTGGGSTPSSYTTSYAATASGIQLTTGGRQSGDLNFSFFASFGYFQYGFGRFRELQGKTILSSRIYLPRVSGSGNVTLSVNGVAGSSSHATGGWVTLSATRTNALIGLPAIQMAEIDATGSGSLQGIPAGTIQITWR